MRRTLFPLFLLLVGLALAGCGDGDGRTTDATGETGPDPPRRIVSLSATHTEILYAIGAGDQVVGTDLTSDYPVAAGDTPKVDAFNFNVEEVAALDPDLVILAFDFSGEVAALEAVGIPALLLPPPATLEEAYEQIGRVAEVTGRDGATVRADMEDAIATALASVGDAAVGRTYFHEIDNTLFTANSQTFIGDVFRQFGLVNIADEVPDEFNSGYVQLSAEALLDADPDFIFLGDAAFGESVATVAERPGWGTLAAVGAGRVIELDGDIAGRWGPRTADLIEQVAAALAAAGTG